MSSMEVSKDVKNKAAERRMYADILFKILGGSVDSHPEPQP